MSEAGSVSHKPSMQKPAVNRLVGVTVMPEDKKVRLLGSQVSMEGQGVIASRLFPFATGGLPPVAPLCQDNPLGFIFFHIRRSLKPVNNYASHGLKVRCFKEAAIDRIRYGQGVGIRCRGGTRCQDSVVDRRFFQRIISSGYTIHGHAADRNKAAGKGDNVSIYHGSNISSQTPLCNLMGIETRNVANGVAKW